MDCLEKHLTWKGSNLILVFINFLHSFHVGNSFKTSALLQIPLSVL